MKAFKIILKEEKDKWEQPLKPRLGTLMFDYKNDELDLKKGAKLYFMGDYVKEFNLEGIDYISINPTDLICQK